VKGFGVFDSSHQCVVARKETTPTRKRDSLTELTPARRARRATGLYCSSSFGGLRNNPDRAPACCSGVFGPQRADLSDAFTQQVRRTARCRMTPGVAASVARHLRLAADDPEAIPPWRAFEMTECVRLKCSPSSRRKRATRREARFGRVEVVGSHLCPRFAQVFCALVRHGHQVWFVRSETRGRCPI
jgi:hypothetical protein